MQNAIKGISMFVFRYSALYQIDHKFSSFSFIEYKYTQPAPVAPPPPKKKQKKKNQGTHEKKYLPKTSRKEKFQTQTKILRLSPSTLTLTPSPPPPHRNLKAKHCDRCMKVVAFLLQNHSSYSAPTDRCTKDVSLF